MPIRIAITVATPPIRSENPCAVEDLGSDVAPRIVGAEQEARVGERPDQRRPAKRQWIARIEEAGANSHRDHEQQQDQAITAAGLRK